MENGVREHSKRKIKETIPACMGPNFIKYIRIKIYTIYIA